MKTRFMLSALAFSLAFLCLSSCSDDDEKGPDNNFTVDGSKVTVQTTLFEYDPTASESPVDGEPYHRHWVFLLGTGLTVNESNRTISGNGDLLELGISGASANLDPGTYEFTGTENNPVAYELWVGRLHYADGSEFIFGEATLEISKSGNTYTIELTATAYPPIEATPWLPDLTKTGKEITATFTGPIVSIEED